MSRHFNIRNTAINTVCLHIFKVLFNEIRNLINKSLTYFYNVIILQVELHKSCAVNERAKY